MNEAELEETTKNKQCCKNCSHWTDDADFCETDFCEIKGKRTKPFEFYEDFESA